MGIQWNGWYFFDWDLNGLSKVAALYTTLLSGQWTTGTFVKWGTQFLFLLDWINEKSLGVNL